MKRRRPRLQLSERQQVILAVLLMLMVSISMLYCLGFASIALRNNWEKAPIPWNNSELAPESVDQPLEQVPLDPTLASPPP